MTPITPSLQKSTSLEDPNIHIIHYNEEIFDEKKFSKIEECYPYKDTKAITWINVEGADEISEIEKLGTHYGLHPLLLEDIVSNDQRPKVDDYENHIFLVIIMLDYDKLKNEIVSEQISFVLGKNYVISFQETGKDGDVFGMIRDKLRLNKGKVRRLGADYLMYSLLDLIVDHYFDTIEKIGEHIEEIESRLITDPTTQTLRRLYALKREMIFVRKAVWPLREVVGKLERLDSNLVQDNTVLYIKDVYDHTVQVIETIESYRDILAGLLDIYLSSISNKLNAVMKVLTIISTIFMPLSFIVGIYGMNFEHMPELKWKYGYFMVIGVCLCVSGTMLMFFRRRKWL